jgi:hypothetical protein
MVKQYILIGLGILNIIVFLMISELNTEIFSFSLDRNIVGYYYDGVEGVEGEG